MKYEPLPVTPGLITWARERAGYSLEEASEYFAHIGAWETSKEAPSYPQLEALAERFKMSDRFILLSRTSDIITKARFRRYGRGLTRYFTRRG